MIWLFKGDHSTFQSKQIRCLQFKGHFKSSSFGSTIFRGYFVGFDPVILSSQKLQYITVYYGIFGVFFVILRESAVCLLSPDQSKQADF